jgi:Type II secretory pathway, prepilin signal peptidase PulO and related peptidases
MTDLLPVHYLELLLTAVIGGYLGSMINVVATRFCELDDSKWWRAIFWPPQHCEACGSRFQPRDCIPVISWFMNRGRCQACGTPLSIRHPIVELVMFVLTPLIFWLTGMHVLGTTVVIVFVCIIIILAITDAEDGFFPDTLLAISAGAGLLTSLLDFPSGPSEAMLGGLVALAAFWVMAKLCHVWFGHECIFHGDIKIAGMIGVWMGLYSAIIAIFIAYGLAFIYGQAAARTMKVSPALLAVRMGPFFATGCVATIVMTYSSILHPAKFFPFTP